MIYIFFATGFEEIEALAQVDILRRAGLGVTTVSVMNEKIVVGAHSVPVVADKLFDEANLSDATALVLPGGMPGSLNLAEHAGLCKAIEEQHAKGRLIAAICAAPMVFGRLGLLVGKRATIYPGMEDELKGAEPTGALVERDGNIITGKGPAAALAFGYAIVEALKGEGSSEALIRGMLYSEAF